jgi:hypothetical protein
MDIKEKASMYKNGNKDVTQKDLLFYIIGRLDELEGKLESYDKEVAKVKTQVKMLLFVIPIVVTFAVYIGGVI